MASGEEKTKDEAISKAADSVLSGLPAGVTAEQLLGADSIKALSQRLAAHINSSLVPVESYPPEVRRRIKALKRLQFETQELEARFYLDVQELEAKYQKLYQPLFDQRHDIITGSHEPTDEEAHWSEDDDDEDPTASDKKTSETNGESSKAVAKGVNQFWLVALKNCEIFADVIKEHDEPVLAHLTDIKVVYADDKGLDFQIEFAFSENEWFSNKTLVKSYKVSCEVNKEDPWSFEGASITGSEGCKIDWKKGKDLTVKTVKKKQKKGKGGQSRTITKTVPNETFFNMFSEPTADQDSDEVAAILSDDYTRAEFLRDRLIPKAVLFFTGEAVEEEDEEFEEDYGSSDEGEDGGEQGDDYDPQSDVNKAKPPECKQQ